MSNDCLRNYSSHWPSNIPAFFHKPSWIYWFEQLTSHARTSPEGILQTTFTHAKLLLRTIIKPQDFESLFPLTNAPNAQHVSSHTMFDVQRCLKEAQASYECRIGHTTDAFQTIAPLTAASTSANPTTPLSKSKAKARLWLTGLSEKLVHYGNIFDVMVQHHPEYVSLAWGTFKFLFIVSTDSSNRPSPDPTSLIPKPDDPQQPTNISRQLPTTPKQHRNSAKLSPKSPTSSRNTRYT